MKLWVRKIFVVLIAVFTLGLYIPPSAATSQLAKNDNVTPDQDIRERATADENRGEEPPGELNAENERFYTEHIIRSLTAQAKIQTETKLGPRIMGQVEGDVIHQIYPKIEEVMTSLIHQSEKEQLPYFEISEQPSAGYGEKIFNLYDARSKQHIAKFHVRREKKPQEGYWFNFHYHLERDHFQQHHLLGDVYWDKNTPPKWMA
ncbi:YpjP family protein [Halobacillus salinarum]|uniref:YpjP family protein n=1 Tax=Halobacillus salinarum TaxID=2932257 RepID=A0ABY4EFC4_9BACI|nr:YpjP family protein [Halobacillus salinarum]UOQ42763.1 YpjP family protein [Halobacillus salinarum]